MAVSPRLIFTLNFCVFVCVCATFKILTQFPAPCCVDGRRGLGWVPRWSISPASALADEQEVLTGAAVRWSDAQHPHAWWWWLVVGVDHHNTLMPYSDLKQTAAWQFCVTKRASPAQRGSVLQPRTALRLPPQELYFRLACMPRPQRNLTREGFGLHGCACVEMCLFFFGTV